MNITDIIHAIWSGGDEGQRAITRLRAAQEEDIDRLFAFEEGKYRILVDVALFLRIALPITTICCGELTYVLIGDGLRLWTVICGMLFTFLLPASVFISVATPFIPSKSYMKTALAISYIDDDRAIPVLLRGLHVGSNMLLAYKLGLRAQIKGALVRRILAMEPSYTFDLDFVTSWYIIYI